MNFLFSRQEMDFACALPSGVSKRSTVALLCYFLPWWCYFSFLVMKGAACRTKHGATATVTCATAKSSSDTPGCLLKETPHLQNHIIDT